MLYSRLLRLANSSQGRFFLYSKLRWLPFSDAGPFKQNFHHVARSNIFALILPILAIPLLSRLFSRADFGVLAVFSAVLAFTLSFATWRFDWLLPNEKSGFVAANLCMAGGVVLLVFALVLILLLFVFPETFVRLGTLAERKQILWLLPFALLAGGTALAQIILFLAMLLLARPYSSRKSSAAHALYRMCGSLDPFSHRSRVCLITITLSIRASLKSDRLP